MGQACLPYLGQELSLPRAYSSFLKQASLMVKTTGSRKISLSQDGRRGCHWLIAKPDPVEASAGLVGE